MRRYQGWLVIITLSLTAWGCNKTEQPATGTVPTVGQAGVQTQNTSTTVKADKPVVKSDTPEATVQTFLEALRSGNDEQAALMMSTIARQKIASLRGSITPPASDTAKFSVGKVEIVGEDGARVASVWSDLDEEGKYSNKEVVWVLRKEPEGWRVVGLAAMVFEGQDPLVFNFEDPEDIKRKQQELNNQSENESDAGTAENRQAEQKNRRWILSGDRFINGQIQRLYKNLQSPNYFLTPHHRECKYEREPLEMEKK